MARETNAARRRSRAQDARERAAAARADAYRRERRRRLLLVGGSTLGVLVVIGVIVAVATLSGGGSAGAGSDGRSAAPAAVTAAVTSPSAATLATIGAGTVSQPPEAVSDPALTSGGKPEVLFIGAEFCPYCAAERWPLVQALSRFGTFTDLSLVRSSSNDVFPDTATFSFHGAAYSSDTVAFTSREVETRTGAPLERPAAAETALWKRYTGDPGSFPFLDIAGRYVITGPSYDPGVLKGLTATQIAARLDDPGSDVAKAVDGAANVLTAAICDATGGKPASVCTAAGVTTAAKTLHG